MDNSVPYLEYLVNRMNKADGINDCIEAILQGCEKIKTIQTTKEGEDKSIKKEEQIPEDLVEQIRIKMMQSETRNETEGIAKELEETLKQRIANGHNVSHVIINSDSYEIYESEQEM